MVFRNLTRRPVKTTLYSLFNFPSIFIEATRLLLGFCCVFDNLWDGIGIFLRKKASEEQPRSIKKMTMRLNCFI